jgi:hypothetical protein
MRTRLVLVAAILIAASLAGQVCALNGNGSTYISDTIPTVMTTGVTYTPTVTMQNTGTSTWTDGTDSTDYNFGPPNVGDPNEAASWGPRTESGGVAPSDTKVFTLTMTPTRQGTYTCRWQMVQESIEWFGDDCTKTIVVQCGTPPVDTVIWADSFDTYGDGPLNGAAPPPSNPTVGSPGWALSTGSQNEDQIVVVADGSGKAIQVSNIPLNSRTSIVNVDTFVPSWNTGNTNNRGRFHFKVKSLTGVGTTFWHVNCQDWPGGGYPYCYISGTDQTLTFCTAKWTGPTAPYSTPQSIADGAWHTVDVIFDTANDLSYYYFDGGYVWTGTHDGGMNQMNKVRSAEIRQHANYEAGEMKVLLDDMSLTTAPALPKNTITSAVQTGYLPDMTATITWTRAWNPCDVAATQVKICTTNDPTATALWDSGDVANPNTSQVTGSLPNATYLYAFERDKLVSGGYQPWSNGVLFTIHGPLCTTDIIGPRGAICTPKPMISIQSCPHTLLRVKVTRDSTGSDVVFDSGEIATTENRYPSGILPSGSYHAFAMVGTPAGWSQWSAGSAFTVDTSCQPVDIRHMDEPDILWTDTCWPNDGFGRDAITTYIDGEGYTEPPIIQTDRVCGNQTLIWNDNGNLGSIRIHKLSCDTVADNVSLDTGVTFLWAVSVVSEGGSDGTGASWRMANTILADKDSSGETHFVAIRTLPGGIGLISDNTAGMEAFGGGFGHHWGAWTPSTDYRVIRLTGRNAVPGDYSSAVWKVYVNDNPTPVITATGCMSASVMETDATIRNRIFPADEIAIGHGSRGSTGVIAFDWTAVNFACDLAPGEWNPFGVLAYASVGAAKAPGVETRPVTIDGSMVITKVVSHTELQGSPPTEVTVQDCYFVQDTVGSVLGPGVKIVSSDSQGGLVAKGARVTHISGIMTELGGCRSVINPVVTIAGSASVHAAAMSQQSLMGPCIDQTFSRSVDSTGMLVRVFGRVATPVGFDETYGSKGAFIVYVDDGSGAIDGRESNSSGFIQGIRCLIDAANPNALVPDGDDYVMLEGIAGYERTTDGFYPNVRQIMYPSFVRLGSGS